MGNDKIIGMVCVTFLSIALVVASYFIRPVPVEVISVIQSVITGIFGAIIGYNLADFKRGA